MLVCSASISTFALHGSRSTQVCHLCCSCLQAFYQRHCMSRAGKLAFCRHSSCFGQIWTGLLYVQIKTSQS